MNLQYLQHHQIDKEKWDAAIENAQNGLVYALSWFLDIVSPNWKALVSGNYDMIMPLIWRSKLGIKYLYQPTFIQQLGIFSINNIDKTKVEYFIAEARKHFKYIDIQLNYDNPGLNSENFVLRNTQLIDLSRSYSELYKNYKKNHKKNLKKIGEADLVIDSIGSSEIFADLDKEMFKRKEVDEITNNDIDDLKKVMDLSVAKGLGEFYFGKLNGDFCAAAFFLKWKERVIVYTALNSEGRKVGAMFGLIDRYLQKNAGNKLLFDFAGSNIPGVKYRNLGFGAYNEVYYRVTENNLPFFIKLFKK